ncbi:uncharacterized protein LOC125756020 [Canis lupus dingo]|uniref:uncharacterized protein LOC125756020 n=1 Tax=Canis lupus dingo TaxID=286419 RepID=UPI000DC66E65|nr:uncharacterized protein LOC125756020 [Canis lupus dingo]
MFPSPQLPSVTPSVISPTSQGCLLSSQRLIVPKPHHPFFLRVPRPCAQPPLQSPPSSSLPVTVPPPHPPPPPPALPSRSRPRRRAHTRPRSCKPARARRGSNPFGSNPFGKPRLAARPLAALSRPKGRRDPGRAASAGCRTPSGHRGPPKRRRAARSAGRGREDGFAGTRAAAPSRPPRPPRAARAPHSGRRDHHRRRGAPSLGGRRRLPPPPPPPRGSPAGPLPGSPSPARGAHTLTRASGAHLLQSSSGTRAHPESRGPEAPVRTCSCCSTSSASWAQSAARLGGARPPSSTSSPALIAAGSPWSPGKKGRACLCPGLVVGKGFQSIHLYQEGNKRSRCAWEAPAPPFTTSRKARTQSRKRSSDSVND